MKGDLMIFALLLECITAQPLLSAGSNCFHGSGFDLTIGCAMASALDAPLLACESDQDVGPCVESNPVSNEVAYTRNVESIQEYSSMMSTAVSAEGGGFGYHVSASVSYMQSSETSDRSVSLFLGQSGTVSTDSIRSVTSMKASDAALTLLQQCESASNCSFVDLYGLHYIEEITYGRSFLGSFTMWDSSTSESDALDTMASFSANDVFFSASASAEFEDAHSEFTENLETIANAQWLGGTGISLDSSTPEAMHSTFMKWNATSFNNPAPMTMTYRNWIDIPEIQSIVNAKNAEVQALFSPQQVASVTTDQITEEMGSANFALSAVNHALDWDCVQQNTDFNDLLTEIKRNITTHLLILQTLKEADIIEIQTQILVGDYSFFVASDYLTAYTTAVDIYYPDGNCGVCETEYQCGSACCTEDYPTCCPAFSGQKNSDSCIAADETCCTDTFSCYSGYTCSPEAQTCCGAGESGCPNADGSYPGSCCTSDYGVCCGLQGMSGGGCCSIDYSICCEDCSGHCCASNYPVCGCDGYCYESYAARELGPEKGIYGTHYVSSHIKEGFLDHFRGTVYNTSAHLDFVN